MENRADKKILHLHKIIESTRTINRLLISENNIRSIIDGVCSILVHTRGYFLSWIIILDKDLQINEFSSAGDIEGFEALKQNILSGDLPVPHREALANNKQVIVNKNSQVEPVKMEIQKWIPIITPIQIDENRKGLLCTAIPKEDALHPKEKITLQDIADNLGFALNKLLQDDILQKSKEAVQRGQEKLQRLMANLPGVAYTCKNTPNWDMTFLSDGCIELFGYSPQELQEGGIAKFRDIIHVEDRQYIWETIQKAVKKNESFELEYKVITKEGEEKWVWERGRTIPGNGDILLEGFITDITKRKKAAEKLIRSEKNYKLLFNAINDSIFIHKADPNKRNCFTDVNKVARKTYGYTQKQFLKLAPRDLSTEKEEVRRISDRFRERLFKNNWAICETEHITGDGTIIQVEVSSQIFESSGEKMVLSLVRDISERKAAEEKLLENEKRYRAVFENTGAATCILEADGTISLANKEFALLSGFPIDEIQNKKSWMQFVHPDDLEKMKTQHSLRRKSNQKVLKQYEFRFIDKNGDTKFINLIVDVIPGTQKSVASLIDMTWQKIAEQKIKENQIKLNSITDSAQDAIVLINNDGNIIFWNPAAEKMFGYTKEEVQNKDLHKLLAPNHFFEKHKKGFERFRRTGRGPAIGVNYDIEAITKEGKIIPIELSLSATKIKDKWGATGIIRDVSQRKRVESELKKNEQKFRSIFENKGTATLIVDEKGTIKLANTQAQLLTGYNKTELENNTSWGDLITKESNNRHLGSSQTIVMDLLPETMKTTEIDLRTKKNTLKNTLVNIELIPQTQDRVISLIDITERKTLERTNKMLSKAMDSTPVSIVITNAQGDIEYVNPFFEEKTGYSQSEVIGKNPRLLKSGKQQKEFYNELWDTICRGKIWEGEFHNKKKNGELFWEQASISPIFNKKNEIIQFIAVKEDVTEKKQTLKDLQAAKEKAEESDKLKSSFLANMSHEIRTPMNGILGFAELLKTPDLTSDKQLEFIDIIHASGERMLSTINDIIDISKIESGLVDVKVERISLNLLMKQQHAFFAPMMQKKGISFITDFKEDPETVIFSDQDKLNSIITNLIKNAFKFTERGSITFGYKEKDKNILLFVSDTGVGIPQNRQKAIFERFVQADIADSRVFEGSGLGLSITKSYVEMLGGTIEVKSELGKGTIFNVSIPIKEPNDKAELSTHKKDMNNTISIPKLNILIAEDDPVSVELLKIVLSKYVHTIQVAKDGVEVIELAKNSEKLDLILMDIKMPKLDGFSATEKIREFNKNVKIIAQTAFAQPTDNQKALDAGCNDFVSKPINKKLLFQAIHRVFNDK